MYRCQRQVVCTVKLLSNCHPDLPNFSSTALSSIAVATATPHSSALYLKQLFCVNITALNFHCTACACVNDIAFPLYIPHQTWQP
ncbi:hypothetical protein DXB47_06035 [Firmicutes bacterium OM04-13BH]|nr:hypothetical protein DXB47_06035 [Firmicutes bacterium OM04-13BH]